MLRLALFFLCAVFLLSSPPAARAQKPAEGIADDTAHGIRLYKQGETKQAIEALRVVVKLRPDDSDAWYHLALALTDGGDLKNARKALEKTVKLRPNHASAHAQTAYIFLLNGKLNDAARAARRTLELAPRSMEAHYILGVVYLREDAPQDALKEAEAAININPKFAPSYLLKSQAIIEWLLRPSQPSRRSGKNVPQYTAEELKKNRMTQGLRYKEAADNLERFIQLTGNSPDLDTWRGQLETLRLFASYAQEPEDKRSVFYLDEVTTRAVLTKKPAPDFTDAARQASVSGTVRLRLILSADGTVSHFFVLKPLSHGLTEAAIDAARKIKFTPATFNGRTVSQFVSIEYHFNYL